MNKQFLLASRPTGTPSSENFKLVEVPIPDLKEGEVLVRSLYISVDPYMRGRMNDYKSYVPPYSLNEPIAGGVVGEVIESKSSQFQTGEIVMGMYGWQTNGVVNGKDLQKINSDIAPISTALGVLGMPGLTAYFGLLDIANPQAGETVVVSGAAGAVGMIVGQIAKIKGARVIGIAGSEEKINYLKEELHFDEVINYKTTSDIKADLRNACPNGVDVYFDNVGGSISDAVLLLINQGARIPLCGQISLYNLEKVDIGPRMQPLLLINSALMQGFIVSNYMSRFHEALPQMAQWVAEGKIKYKETIVEGFENMPTAFLGLFSGENIGKQLVRVAD
ncbi:NADP-dependent oxidoreductase [Hazenella sp. IB182357]|uniref:NADP-dependent oxidoreductase n=1 Tax=Polycladospora coralii TaxID=2771432 RepID=A0A926NB95_9BACL|nr:NADP-dependent oxidoreductase [Polycladospora coralii]MBD1373002.1 NADP-dependent oxidoreductase [Polycladospora coralii]